MYKEAIICIIGTFCILQIVDSHPEIASNSFDSKNEAQDIKYIGYPESHGESKLCFQPLRMADNSSVPFVELRIDSFAVFDRSKQSSEILALEGIFLYVVEPSYLEYAREELRLIKLGLNFCDSNVKPFLNTIAMVVILIFYGVSNLYLLYKWKSINKTLQKLPKKSHKEKIKLVIMLLLVPVGSILLSFLLYLVFNLPSEDIDLFYEQKVRFDLDQGSKLCLTPQQFAKKLATILSEKKINDIANFNQADKLVQDFNQEEQHIIIIRQTNLSQRDSIIIIGDNFWHRRRVDSFLKDEYLLLLIFSLIPIPMVIVIILLICFIKLLVKWTYVLLDRVSDMKKEFDSKVIVTPVLTLESNLEGSVTSELCTEKK
ncbi:uncharacterized protein LOC123259191 isoform X2 [Cotesia glomerata]|uniref:uncharacterized protein LOC123259191 isoform X2 n=1 Tax=Cotesia glomerata TaxID=32391 RepID=UPI001D02B65F|nr:uncharacterized protein LOC123259191 isoform X2 [Cotesia glomerata]